VGLKTEYVGIIYGHLEYITVIWYILWPFGNLVVICCAFPRFGISHHEKSGNADLAREQDQLRRPRLSHFSSASKR
jgi:hypothetical protein